MTIYCIDSYYTKDNVIKYYVFPYDMRNILFVYFGFDIYPLQWKFSFLPWYYRFIQFIKRMKHCYLSENKAQKVADKLNNME